MQKRIVSAVAVLLSLSTEAVAGDLELPVLSGAWQWVETVTPVETINPQDPERYVLQFEEGGGRAFITADCNRGQGQVAAGDDGAIKFGPIALTRAMCPPGSLSDRFASDLGRVVHYFSKGGDLYLELPVDSGVLRFAREPQ